MPITQSPVLPGRALELIIFLQSWAGQEHRVATEAVAHLGVIWALPSRPSAGLFLPSGITGQATWAGWLPHLNPFMWLPVGMGPTGVTPGGVGWGGLSPSLCGSQAGAGKTPFPLMEARVNPGISGICRGMGTAVDLSCSEFFLLGWVFSPTMTQNGC